MLFDVFVFLAGAVVGYFAYPQINKKDPAPPTV